MKHETSLIACKDVGFRYEGQLAVSGITCAVDAGDYLCIVGENGSGKSTLVRGMLGLLKPSEGVITFDAALRSSDIGYLPQQNAIQRGFPASVQEVVLSGRLGRLGLLPLYTRADRAAAHEALKLLGISELAKASFSELSGGQQQRVLLARALCAADDGLKILILDEPMNGLDPHVKQEMYACITSLNEKQGIAVVMVTHDVQTAVKFARHMLVLNGRQEFFGTAHDFEHAAVGADLLRDACGGTCAVCGLPKGTVRQ
ncbi:MAG: ABC transporter ATP-binding protein [Coriobacteriales bacterium]|jgi:zinc transport system ATP-binding protein|nr:ABC transporter ATP-binding protein [Coriobacteriales bacterium]